MKKTFNWFVLKTIETGSCILHADMSVYEY